jgi:hypothetical protein
MPDPIGYAFAPGADRGMADQAGQRPYSREEALQILSLVLPRAAAPNSPIPQGLLTAPGAQGGADPGIALLQQILAAIGQPPPAGAAPAGGGMSPAGAAPGGGPPSPFAASSVSSLSQPQLPQVTGGSSTGGGSTLPKFTPGETPTTPTPSLVMQPPSLPKAPFQGPIQTSPSPFKKPFVQTPY